MNISVYLFGKFDNGYSQYPDDWTKSIFQRFEKNAAATQVAIHRDGDLMYYGYIRKLEGEKYLGLCVVINGRYITRITQSGRLFSAFEAVVEDMAGKGYLIRNGNGGEVETYPGVGKLHEKGKEVHFIDSRLQTAFDSLEDASAELPAVSYGVSGGSEECFTAEDEEQDIVQSSYRNDYTYISKSKGYNTAQMDSHKGVSAKKNKETESLRKERSEFPKEREKPIRREQEKLQRALSESVKGVTFEMVPVEGGTFTMGAADDDNYAFNWEKPAHEVTLSSYYIGKTEVTQALWKAVMGSNPSRFKGDNLPVEQVSWDDCQKFIRRINAATGKQFRLPTEAEWEYAARGGNQSKGYKYSGSNNLDKVAWYGEDWETGSTHPVGKKQPNELGLYDMSGNVWEWCADWYGDYSSEAQTNPTGPREWVVPREPWR